MECDFCTNFDTEEPKLKEINMYKDINNGYCLDVERSDGIFIPEGLRNKRLYINYCPMCGRKLGE